MVQASLHPLRARLAARGLTPSDLFACAGALDLLARTASRSHLPVYRVAVAGDLTVDLVGRAIACAIAQEGELPLLHTASFGTMRQECLDRGSALHAFRPEMVVLIPDWRHSIAPLPMNASRESVHAQILAQVEEFRSMWTALEPLGCAIIQHLLVTPSQRLRGVADRLSVASVDRRVHALNEALLEAGTGRVTWVETDRLAALSGLAAWSPARFYHAGKLGFDPRLLVDYLPWFRGAWRTATGRAKKLLVLDLDDTLWGGAIGDEGVEGIALGPGHGGRGEAFAAWQAYLAALGQRGVILAVCSKNAPALAVAGFDHPDSALRRDDFAAFICSWEDKASGLRRIASDLDIGLDAMVFADDNPAERLLVQQLLPDVEVVDVGEDPAQFVERLEAGHWFDLQAYTDADERRTAAYTGRRRALEDQGPSVDIAPYLASLEMTGYAGLAEPGDLARLAQMELKTNQFNLTTRRHSQAQLATSLAQPDRMVLALHLKDRFINHGLVGSMVAVRESNALRIDSWLLSCRVFGRTAEQFMLAALVRLARAQGLTSLTGEYIASVRNGVVEDLYARLGFAPESDNGRYWRRELTAPLDDLVTSIAGTRR